LSYHPVVPPQQRGGHGKGKTLSTQFYGSMQSPKYGDLLNDYKSVYEKVDMKRGDMQEIRNDIQGLGGFLKKAEKELEDLRDKVSIIVDARAGFSQNLSTYHFIQIR